VTNNETQTYNADRKMDVTGTDTNTITGAHSGTRKSGRTQTVSGQDDVLNVALNRTSTIIVQYHIQADAEYKVTHKSNVILLSGTRAEVTNGKCKSTMDGGKLMVEAPESLTIKCGDTSITLTTNECTIKGLPSTSTVATAGAASRSTPWAPRSPARQKPRSAATPPPRSADPSFGSTESSKLSADPFSSSVGLGVTKPLFLCAVSGRSSVCGKEMRCRRWASCDSLAP
jgi:hypothetical protein